MSSSSVIATVRGLGKKYRIARATDHHVTLAEAALGWARHPMLSRRRDDFWALRGVDLDIHEGEAIGIVGRNGAGKSTLLKLLSQITHPTEGGIDLYGRVGSLLEVGTGFHPELTGRENILLNGTILGMRRREIEQRFDEIVDFAGVERFLDTPIKRYSSGMQVRLAFAVAVFLDTEILIIDEVLAVGDADFQQRCLGKMSDVTSGGRTVIFVSHNAAAVEQLTSRCVLLGNGEVQLIGPSHEVLASYSRQRVAANEADMSATVRRGPGLAQDMRMTRVIVRTNSAELIPDATPTCDMDLELDKTAVGARVVVVYRIMRTDGVPVGTGVTSAQTLPNAPTASLQFPIAAEHLAPGHYYLAIAVSSPLEAGLVPFDYLEETVHFELPPNFDHPLHSRWGPEWGVSVLASTPLSLAPTPNV